MKRSKKIFILASAAFFVMLGYVSYDISSRTTFPGSKSQLKERIKDRFTQQDSLEKDSVKYIQR